MLQITQAEAVVTLESEAARMHALLADVPEPEFERPATVGGGEWSAKDLVGHVATWEEFALAAIAEREFGEPWPTGARLQLEGTTDEINDEAVREWSTLSAAQTRARAVIAHREILSRIGGLSDELWFGSAGLEAAPELSLNERLGGILGNEGSAFGHVRAHLPDLEAFVASLR